MSSPLTTPNLQRLEEMLAEERARPAEFNLFEQLNLWWQEDIHSRILTWLLNPTGNHGVGDYFLTNFLAQLDLPDSIGKASDWSKSESQREWYCVVDGGGGWLDILLTNDDAKFACAIENKIFSPEGGRQLTHYRKAVEAAYPAPDFTKRYVFLPPHGMESQWEDEREHWKPMNYTSILQLVEQAIEDKRAAMNKDVRSFLRQYVATLRRNIVPNNNELQQLARQIYLEHREAIELIYQHKPDYRAEFKRIIKECMAGYDGWQLDGEDASYVRFHPVSWNELGEMWTGTGWPSKALVLCQFYCTDSNVHFYFTLSPGEYETIRDIVIESVRQSPATFNRAGVPTSASWMSVHVQEHILHDADLNNWDDEDAVGPVRLRNWIDNLVDQQFPAINEVIVNCLREYEAETQGQ